MKELTKSNKVISDSKSVSNNRNSRLTDPKKRAHVEKYIKSNQTQQEYCSAHKLKLSRFKNWKLRYEREQSHHFTPAITLPTVSINSEGIRLELIKKDCKVVISGIEDTGTISAIIKEL